MRLYSGVDPVLDEEDQFKVTIPLDEDHNPEDTLRATGEAGSQTEIQTGIQTGIQTSVSVDDIDRRILEFLSSNATLTITAVAEKMGLARITIAKHIRKLKAAGLLVRVGGRARGVWKVLIPVPPSSIISAEGST